MIYTIKVVLPASRPALPVFAFAAAVESLQWLGITEKLGLQDTVLGIILGATFDFGGDLLCYGAECAAFAAVSLLTEHR